ncbi:MAG: hypothetical protein ACRDSE_14770 [Pseudonocardiaceae bacterium]
MRTRRDELADQIADTPESPPREALAEIADHASKIIRTGSDTQRKALVETLIAEIKIAAADRIVPIFRIPQPPTQQPAPNAKEALAGSKSRTRASEERVRAMTSAGLRPIPTGMARWSARVAGLRSAGSRP